MNKQGTGWTLIELLITLLILALIGSLVLPSWIEFTHRHHLSVQYNRLLESISLARSEAIMRNHRIILCPSTNSQQCDQTDSGWQNGWIIFVDSQQNNRVDSDESILFVQLAIKDLVINYGRRPHTRPRIAFHPTGHAVGGNNGTFLFCRGPKQLPEIGLTIANTGRARKAEQKKIQNKRCR